MRILNITAALCLSCASAIGTSQIIISEVQSSNASTISDEFGEFDDWIELQNIGNETVDVAGLVLKDQLDTWYIPDDENSTELAPGDFLLLWCDDQEFQGPFHTNFKISASNGEFLGLYENDATTVIDSYDIPPLSDDQSIGQCPGAGWLFFITPTPLEENNCGTSVLEPLSLSGIRYSRVHNLLSLNFDMAFDGCIDVHDLQGRLLHHRSLQGQSCSFNLSMNHQMLFIVVRSRNGQQHQMRIGMW